MNDAPQRPEPGAQPGVFVEPFLTAVLDGRKTLESRFGRHRRAPYRCVAWGDIIALKRSGGPVVGLAMAGSTRFLDLSPSMLAELRETFETRLYAFDDAFWTACSDKRFATLIEIDDPISIPPMLLDKRDRRGWVTYTPAAAELLCGC